MRQARARLTSVPARLRRAVRLALSLVAIAAVAACGGADVAAGPGSAARPGAGSGAGGGTGTGTSTQEPQLVGRWSRTIWFYDSFGSLHSSQTVWTFAADGGAARTVTATNWTDGWSDATVQLARWRTEGRDVVIAWQPPDAGAVRFAFRFESSIDGPLLYLGETAFFKVST